MADINWDLVREKLPYEKTPQQKELRKKLFDEIDDNASGKVSLAEMDAAVRLKWNLEGIATKNAIDAAFHASKKIQKSEKSSDDYIEFREFRYFLEQLRRYIEIDVAFKKIDEDGSNKLSLEEFEESYDDNLAKFLGGVDAKTAFAECDKDGGGQIRFREFVEWALEKNIEIDVDDDAS